MVPAVTSRRPDWRRPLGPAALAIAVGLSLLLPVAGTLAVAVLLTLFRAADRVRPALAALRSVRAARARHALVLIGSILWALISSAAEMALLAPLLLAAAAMTVGVAAIIADGGAPVLSAEAAVAAVYTTLSCLVAGSSVGRREVRRAVTTLASNPLAAAMTLVTLIGLAIAIASLVLVKALPL